LLHFYSKEKAHTWELLFGIENLRERALSHHAQFQVLQGQGLQCMDVDPHIPTTHHIPAGKEQITPNWNSNSVMVL
jgi:hypothetical protein